MSAGRAYPRNSQTGTKNDGIPSPRMAAEPLEIAVIGHCTKVMRCVLSRCGIELAIMGSSICENGFQ
jgi:hypothetical protein